VNALVKEKDALSQKLNQVLSVEAEIAEATRTLRTTELEVENYLRGVRGRSPKALEQAGTILAGKKALVTILPNDIEQSAAFLETLVDELAKQDEIFHTAFLRAADSEAKPWFDKIAKLLQPFCVMPDGNGPAFARHLAGGCFLFRYFPSGRIGEKVNGLKDPNHHRPEAFRRQVIDRTQELLAFYETWEKNGSAFVPKAIFGTP